MSEMEYNDSSISQLKGADRVRKRPEALLGSSGIDGAKHTIQEIIGNATDERLAGYGDKLDISYDKDGTITIRDYGRGVPLGWNEKEQAWNYNLIYSELYAGGKYSDNQEILKGIDSRNEWGSFRLLDYPYLITIGLNGLGAACAQYTSEYFTVISYRDGKSSRMDFEKGSAVLEDLVVEDTTEPNGTLISWKPDIEVFSDVNIPESWLVETCKALAYVSGFDVNLDYQGKVTEYPHNTISGTLQEWCGVSVDSHAFRHIVDNSGDICICDVETSIGPAKGNKKQEYFHNKIAVHGGAHQSGVRAALYRFFVDIGSKEGIRIMEGDYSNQFSVIVSTLANKASLRNQTKDCIDDDWIAELITDTIYESLDSAYHKGVSWLGNIIEETIQNAKNRLAVAEMSKQLREVQKATSKHKASNKFVTCRSYEDGKRVAETEFLIVEGDSAGGNVVQARDSDFQCLLKIRGKSLNVFKAPLTKLIENKEILDMISILGCGIDLNLDDFESFEMDKLKVGKVIFCSDADVDGLHIRVLLFLIMYRLFPKLLSNGNVYVADTPLYVINKTDGTSVYCMNNAELAEKQEEIGSGYIRSIDRFKGLGECDPAVLWETTLCPKTRSLRQIKIDPKETEVYEALEILFGKSTDIRKEFILGNMLEEYQETMGGIDEMLSYIEGLSLDSDLQIEEVVY